MKILLIAKEVKISSVDRLEGISSEDLLRVEVDLYEKKSLLKEAIRAVKHSDPEAFESIFYELLTSGDDKSIVIKCNDETDQNDFGHLKEEIESTIKRFYNGIQEIKVYE